MQKRSGYGDSCKQTHNNTESQCKGETLHNTGTKGAAEPEQDKAGY